MTGASSWSVSSVILWLRSLREKLAWWIADYAFAGYWQMRALFGSRRVERYRTGDANPVLAIPGIWETWRFMLSLIVKIHDAGHPVYLLPQLRRNARPVADSARMVADFVRGNDLRGVVIVAHSKGGMIGKYAMAFLDEDRRFSGMVAIATPFFGSDYAKYLVLPSLRALSPDDPTTLSLDEAPEVNGRIVSVFGVFDPHIPAGSRLPGAHNLELPTGGHFRILGLPETLAAVLDAAG